MSLGNGVQKYHHLIKNQMIKEERDDIGISEGKTQKDWTLSVLLHAMGKLLPSFLTTIF